MKSHYLLLDVSIFSIVSCGFDVLFRRMIDILNDIERFVVFFLIFVYLF